MMAEPSLQQAVTSLTQLCPQTLLHRARQNEGGLAHGDDLLSLDQMSRVPNSVPEIENIVKKVTSCLKCELEKKLFPDVGLDFVLTPIPIGSYPIGAKVGDVDEFDFLLVLESSGLNHPIEEVPHKKEKLADSLPNTFAEKIHSEIKTVFTTIILDDKPPNVYRHGPATCLELGWTCPDQHWHSLSIDFTLGVRLCDSSLLEYIKTISSLSDGPFKKLFKVDSEVEEVVVVYSGLEWVVTSSILDQPIFGILSSISDNVLVVYRLLKVLCHQLLPLEVLPDSNAKTGYRGAPFFSSHALKSVLFHEVHLHPLEGDWTESLLAERLMGILEKLTETYEMGGTWYLGNIMDVLQEPLPVLHSDAISYSQIKDQIVGLIQELHSRYGGNLPKGVKPFQQSFRAQQTNPKKLASVSDQMESLKIEMKSLAEELKTLAKEEAQYANKHRIISENLLPVEIRNSRIKFDSIMKEFNGLMRILNPSTFNRLLGQIQAHAATLLSIDVTSQPYSLESSIDYLIQMAYELDHLSQQLEVPNGQPFSMTIDFSLIQVKGHLIKCRQNQVVEMAAKDKLFLYHKKGSLSYESHVLIKLCSKFTAQMAKEGTDMDISAVPKSGLTDILSAYLIRCPKQIGDSSSITNTTDRRYYYLESNLNGKVIEVQEEYTLCMSDKRSGHPDKQLWYDDGEGYIRSKVNDWRLCAFGDDLSQAGIDRGSRKECEWHFEEYQLEKMKEWDDSRWYGRISNKNYESLILDIERENQATGARVIVYTDKQYWFYTRWWGKTFGTLANQQWRKVLA